jgi:hypothetical protein
MKLFQFQGCFELPDDFAGTKADALRLLAAYLDDQTLPETSFKISEGEREGWVAVFYASLPAFAKGKRLHACFALEPLKYADEQIPIPSLAPKTDI